MSRLSRANLKARESIFASGPEHYIGDTQARCPPDLEECIMALEDCCEEVRDFSLNFTRFSSSFAPRYTKRRFYYGMAHKIFQG